MVITPSEALLARVQARIHRAGSATGFDMEVRMDLLYFETR